MEPTANNQTFISYSWDDDVHCAWVLSLAIRLRSAGVHVVLDAWDTVLGDEMPAFMDNSIRTSQFAIIICTPQYKERSEKRLGGVGFEGSIITAEILQGQDERKFIPVLRRGTWIESAPLWLSGKRFTDLSHNPYREDHYSALRQTLLGHHAVAPPVGDSVADNPFSSDVYSRTWIPPSDKIERSQPSEESLPFRVLTAEEYSDSTTFWHLLVVVSDADQLERAREIARRGNLVVIWAWLLPERIAVEAERDFPVVYGITSATEVRDAYTQGPGITQATAAAADAEAAFGFPDDLGDDFGDTIDRLRRRLDSSGDT